MNPISSCGIQRFDFHAKHLPLLMLPICNYAFASIELTHIIQGSHPYVDRGSGFFGKYGAIIYWIGVLAYETSETCKYGFVMPRTVRFPPRYGRNAGGLLREGAQQCIDPGPRQPKFLFPAVGRR